MSRNSWIRQFHRWMSVLFTVTVIANLVQIGMGRGNPPNLVTYSPLLPLAVMFFTGAYMFLLPYVGTRNKTTSA